MKIASLLAASLVLVSVACSSSNTPEQDKGLEGDGVAAASGAPDTNPEGKPYPKEGIGTIARKGDTPGSRIANFKFMGYKDADVTNLQPLSLAQFFDPDGKNIKVLHIQASGVWCTYCRGETELVVPMKDELAAKGAIWVVSLAEGAVAGTASKQKDLDGWIAEFKSPFTHFLDPNNANLGPFYDRSALPWNANIDATTMEILTAGTGAAQKKEDIIKEIDDALEMAKSSKLTKQ
jgi:hypothetical protein